MNTSAAIPLGERHQARFAWMIFIPVIIDGLLYLSCKVYFTGAKPLLAFARDAVIPVDEGAVGVVPPSPNVQLEMCGQAVPVRAVDKLKRLALEHRRTAVIGEPGIGDND